MISGYLITSIVLAERAAGTFSLAGFYERRARRILPALFLVMAVCIPIAWVVSLPADMQAFAGGLVSVALFVSNVYFWLNTGYFESQAEANPLLHTWSLAVEEQYYLFFPLLVLLLWRFGRRVQVACLVSLGLASLALAHWAVHGRPVPAFFLLPTRGWELLVGSSVAYHLMGRREPCGPRGSARRRP